MKKQPNRVPFNRLVKPATVKLCKRMAKMQGISEGRIVDLAIEYLASSSAYGAEHVRVPTESFGPIVTVTPPKAGRIYKTVGSALRWQGERGKPQGGKG